VYEGRLYAKKCGLDQYSVPHTPIYFICIALCTDVNGSLNIAGFDFAVDTKDIDNDKIHDYLS
jgi:hypothetical protein